MRYCLNTNDGKIIISSDYTSYSRFRAKANNSSTYIYSEEGSNEITGLKGGDNSGLKYYVGVAPYLKSHIAKLKEYRIRQNKEKMNMVGSYKNNDLVICRTDGDYIIPASLTGAFTAMLDRYGLRRIRLHDLRHTYCSLSLNYYNIPATTVAKQAGHCNPKVTIGQYSHSNAELQKQSAEVFEHNLFADVANIK